MDQNKSVDQNLKHDKGYANYYCPTCSTPREKQKFPLPEEFETYSCLKCKKVIAFGYLLSLHVKCPGCGQIIKAG